MTEMMWAMWFSTLAVEETVWTLDGSSGLRLKRLASGERLMKFGEVVEVEFIVSVGECVEFMIYF